jgi:hypothetical protein
MPRRTELHDARFRPGSIAQGLFANDVSAMSAAEFEAHVSGRLAQVEDLRADFLEAAEKLDLLRSTAGLWHQGYLSDDQLQRWLAEQPA